MNIRPLHDRVIVKRVEPETRTASGLYIPDAAGENRIKVKFWQSVLASAMMQEN